MKTKSSYNTAGEGDPQGMKTQYFTHWCGLIDACW